MDVKLHFIWMKILIKSSGKRSVSITVHVSSDPSERLHPRMENYLYGWLEIALQERHHFPYEIGMRGVPPRLHHPHHRSLRWGSPGGDGETQTQSKMDRQQMAGCTHARSPMTVDELLKSTQWVWVHHHEWRLFWRKGKTTTESPTFTNVSGGLSQNFWEKKCVTRHN